jgi:uncharacterized protein YegP (UPF0339 family)
MAEEMRFETFERVTLRGRRYFFRLVAGGNNEILAQSQPYKTERQRDRTVALIRAGAGHAGVTRGVRA